MPTEIAAHLTMLLNTDPEKAVQKACAIDIGVGASDALQSVVAATMVDGGAMTRQPEVIARGLRLYRELHKKYPRELAYNLGNALLASVGHAPSNPEDWLAFQEKTAVDRAEARKAFSSAAEDLTLDPEVRTQALTNLANQFSGTFRMSEAHDARLSALRVDPKNGVAALCAARDLMWLFSKGGCSELTRIEAATLAKVAKDNPERVFEFAGAQAAQEIASMVNQVSEPPPRPPHNDPFIKWVEAERLTLAPTVELVDPTLGKIDWLMLPGITEYERRAIPTPPPIFAMFNGLKADFILARDLAWRSLNDHAWPSTGRFADTLDYALYGPHSSALVLALRTALDILDKVAVAANHHFKLVETTTRAVSFGGLWRNQRNGHSRVRTLIPSVSDAIRGGSNALYALVELADDYESEDGILRRQKDLRNAGTHRFIVLHDLGDPEKCRQAPEVRHVTRDDFVQQVLRALRVGRSAIQALALAIMQREEALRQKSEGLIGQLFVPEHDWIRGRDSGD